MNIYHYHSVLRTDKTVTGPLCLHSHRHHVGLMHRTTHVLGLAGPLSASRHVYRHWPMLSITCYNVLHFYAHIGITLSPSVIGTCFADSTIFTHYQLSFLDLGTASS